MKINLEWKVKLFSTKSSPGTKASKYLMLKIGLTKLNSDASSKLELKLDEISKNIYYLVLHPLTEKKIKDFVQDDEPALLSKWITKRINKLIEGRLKLLSLEVELDGKKYIEDFKNKGNNKNFKLSGNLIKKLLSSYDITMKFGAQQNQRLTNNKSWGISNKLISGKKIIPIITFVCPPYTKPVNDKKFSGYNGLHHDFNVNPLAYGFDYSFILYLNALKSLAKILQEAGINVKPVIIFGDWSLVDLPGIKKTLKTKINIIRRLKEFEKSMKIYISAYYPEIIVSTFQELGVQNYMPLGFSTNPSERKNWIKKQVNANKIDWIDKKILDLILNLNKDKLSFLFDWKNYRSINVEEEYKKDLVDFLKTYHNIAWIRLREKKEKKNYQSFSYLASKNAEIIRLDAYYDALLRFIEYKLYGKLAIKKFGPSICCYQDTTFTAAGNCFFNDKFPVLFINPYLL